MQSFEVKMKTRKYNSTANLLILINIYKLKTTMKGGFKQMMKFFFMKTNLIYSEGIGMVHCLYLTIRVGVLIELYDACWSTSLTDCVLFS